MENKTYLIVYQTETNGDILIESHTAEEIKEITEHLYYSDYAIIDGNVLKGFENKSFNLKKL